MSPGALCAVRLKLGVKPFYLSEHIRLLILYGVVYWKKVGVFRPILVLVLMLYMLVIHFLLLVLVLIVMEMLLKPVVDMVIDLRVSVPIVFFVLVSMRETGQVLDKMLLPAQILFSSRSLSLCLLNIAQQLFSQVKNRRSGCCKSK